MADMHDPTSVEKTPEPIATAARSPAAPAADLRFDASTTTSASLELNAVPCVYAVEVQAHERLSGALLRVAIDGQPVDTATVFTRGLETIDAGASLAVDTHGLELPVELLRRSTEREQVDLVATLTDANGNTLATSTATSPAAPSACSASPRRATTRSPHAPSPM